MSSRPSAARRRFHRDRVIARRIGQARALSLTDPAEFVRGRLADHQQYVGCHRPRCGICHPHKRFTGRERRQRARDWRRDESVGL